MESINSVFNNECDLNDCDVTSNVTNSRGAHKRSEFTDGFQFIKRSAGNGN